MTPKKKKKRKQAQTPEGETDQVELLPQHDPPAEKQSGKGRGKKRGKKKSAVSEADAPGVDVPPASAGTDSGDREAPDGSKAGAAAAAVGQPAESNVPSGRSGDDRDIDRGPPPPDDDGQSAAVRPAGDRLARAKDLVASGRVQEAIDLYLNLLEDNPDSLKAHNNLGVLFDELRRHELALAHFEEAERLGPENVEVLTNFGGTLTMLARYEDGEAVLKRALRLAPDDVPARLAMGILSFRRGLYAQAEAELGWVCERDETHGVAHYYRGEALNRVGRYDEAEVLVERAADLMPNDPRPFLTLGHLMDRKNQRAEASEMYRRARELQS